MLRLLYTICFLSDENLSDLNVKKFGCFVGFFFYFFLFSGEAAFHLRTEPWFVGILSYSSHMTDSGEQSSLGERGRHESGVYFSLGKKITTFPTI